MPDSRLGVVVIAAMLVGAAIGGGATTIALSGGGDGPGDTDQTTNPTDPLSAESLD